MVSFGFANTFGFLALLSIIPLIILYLIRPKPKQIDVPSLMFFQKDEKRKTERAFFRRLTKDWLFLAQLLALLLLSLFFIQPYITMGKSLLLDNVVIVVDTSASTGAGHVFDKVIEKAKDAVGARNTVIVVSNTPHVGIENADRKDTLLFLNSLRIGATESPVGEAMMLANEYIEGNKPTVFVISDFMNTGSTNIETAKGTLEKAGAAVQLVDVGEDKVYHNIGIVDLKLGEKDSTALIKNFNDEAKIVDITVKGITSTITLSPHGVEAVPFSTTTGVTKISISSNDDLKADNDVHISIPSLKSLNVLLLTDGASKYLQAALTSSPYIKIDMANSLPSKKYDVYVIQNVKALSTSDAADLTQRVKDGAGLVIHAQENMEKMDFGELLPVTIDEKLGFGVIEENQANRFTKDIQFGGVQHYFSTKKDNGVTLASISNSSIISLQALGRGKIAYYGILEDASDFTLNPGYPIFWVNLAKYLGDLKTVSDMNKQGGSVLSFPEKKTVKTPSGTLYTRALFMDEAGVYEVDGESFAVNLLSEKESSLSQDSRGALGILNAAEKESAPKQPIGNTLLIIALIIILIELLMTKLRGDV